MARTEIPTGIEQTDYSDTDLPGLTTMADAVNYLTAMDHEASENALAVAKEINYDGPLTLGAIDDGIRFYQRRTAEGCMEIGKRLLIMRELAPRGEFLDRIKLHGLSKSTAYRFMQVARKFAKRPNLGSLAVTPESAGKFLELLIFDDDEITALEEGGTVRGINFDAIDLMSASELKKALRDANERIEAKDKVIQDKSTKIDEQAEKLATLESKKRTEAPVSPEQRLLDLRSNLQITSAGIKTNVMTDLRRHLMALYDHAEASDGSETVFMAQCIIEIGRELTILRDEYNLPDNLNDSPASDSVWAAVMSGEQFEVPGAAEFAERMAAAKAEG